MPSATCQALASAVALALVVVVLSADVSVHKTLNTNLTPTPTMATEGRRHAPYTKPHRSVLLWGCACTNSTRTHALINFQNRNRNGKRQATGHFASNKPQPNRCC